MGSEPSTRPYTAGDRFWDNFFDIAFELGPLAGWIVFLGVWLYLFSAYGFMWGGLLGWLPALFLRYVVWGLWHLIVIVLFLAFALALLGGAVWLAIAIR